MVATSALLMTPVSPLAPTGIQVPGIDSAKVELTAKIDPITPWLNVFSSTFTNAISIGEAVVADPAPALRQIIANQLAYGETLITGLAGVGENAIKYVTETAPMLLKQGFEALMQGDVIGAFEHVNNLVGQILFVALPLFDVAAIPGKIANNFARVVNKVTSLDVLLPLVAGVLSPIQGVVNALGDQGQAFVDALGAGDPLAAFNAIINIPAVVTGAILNGYESTTGNVTSGLFTPDTDGIGGLFHTLFVAIPKAIAEALAPPVTLASEQDTTDPAAVPNLTTAVVSLQTSVDAPADAPQLGSDPVVAAAHEVDVADEQVPVVEDVEAPNVDEVPAESVTEVDPEAETAAEPVAETEVEAEVEAGGSDEGSVDESAAEESETEAPTSEPDGDDQAGDAGADNGAGDGSSGDDSKGGSGGDSDE